MRGLAIEKKKKIKGLARAYAASMFIPYWEFDLLGDFLFFSLEVLTYIYIINKNLES